MHSAIEIWSYRDGVVPLTAPRSRSRTPLGPMTGRVQTRATVAGSAPTTVQAAPGTWRTPRRNHSSND